MRTDLPEINASEPESENTIQDSDGDFVMGSDYEFVPDSESEEAEAIYNGIPMATYVEAFFIDEEVEDINITNDPANEYADSPTRKRAVSRYLTLDKIERKLISTYDLFLSN